MNASIAARNFNKQVRNAYKKRGRDFLWRRTRDPYKIYVSEIMLQQTGVERVKKYFRAFIKKFPSWRSLSQATTTDVLSIWKGLGYNRRALNMIRAARIVVGNNKKHLREYEFLLSLPGVGPGTAGAISAFAFNIPAPFIETNIRKAIIHDFFPLRRKVSDREILGIIENIIDKKNPREWYFAVVDYGVELRKEGKIQNSRSAHWKPQSKFEGSRRQRRSRILWEILHEKKVTLSMLNKKIGKDVSVFVEELEHEGFIEKKKGYYCVKKSQL